MTLGSPQVIELNLLNWGIKLELSQQAVLGRKEWDDDINETGRELLLEYLFFYPKVVLWSKLRDSLHRHFII